MIYSGVLSVAQFRSYEKSSVFSEGELIAKAGAAVVAELELRFPKRSVLVLCGPGNNGKDGVAIANLLKDKGWPVRVLSYEKPIEGCSSIIPRNLAIEEDLVIDSIFGIGLSRDLGEDLKVIVEKINASNSLVVSVDIASGINSDTGSVMGVAVNADLTVTFSSLKFGHVLSPGRYYSGTVCIRDIGIDTGNDPSVFLNLPTVWKEYISLPSYRSHKYSRGYSVVCSVGMRSVGAVKLAATAALRVGSGAVAVACTDGEIALYATALTSVMYKTYEDVYSDNRVRAILIGPGGESCDESLKSRVIEILSLGKSCVLDAGALSVFQGDSERLFDQIRGKNVVITPHEGEFGRIFPAISEGTPVERAMEAAKISGSIVVLKGHETVIADPFGKVAINNNAPSFLATAGSGDVLAGIITGLIASGVPGFYAACCGVWIHGECGKKYRLGLIADDIVQQIPSVLAEY